MPYMPCVVYVANIMIYINRIVDFLLPGQCTLLRKSLQVGWSITPKRWKFQFGHHLRLHMHPKAKTISGGLASNAEMAQSVISLQTTWFSRLVLEAMYPGSSTILVWYARCYTSLL